MSIALDTLVLFIFILIPGITFRRFYFQGEFTKQFNSKSLAHSMSASIFPGILIQFLTAFVYKSYIQDIDGNSVELFYKKLSENTLPENIFNTDLLLSLLVYVILMLLISFLIAEFAWRFIRYIRADRWSTILRFKNHWNYYFKGELKGFKEYKGLIKGTIIEVRADILIRIENEEPRLYSGILNQHTINGETNQLENVYMSKVAIYKRNKETNQRERKNIPGDLMIFNACDIININLNYAMIPKKRKDLSHLFNLMFLVGFAFVIFNDYSFFNASTFFKTVLLRIYILFYLLAVFTLFNEIFNSKNKEKKNQTIKGILLLILILSILFYLLRYVIFS